MKTRIKIAHKLAEDLSKFDESLKGKFMCPVCTNVYDVNDEDNITDAHIIPNAVGGKELTLLCKSCNSIFGSNQDKWFGEYLNILIDENKTILSAKTKSKYININGVKVRGDLKESDDGGIDVFLHIDRNPPGKIDTVPFGKTTNISIEVPLAKNQKQIDVGYLTSAYLMWFKQLGYSWVFQGHLNGVRSQIQNPDKPILQGSFFIDVTMQSLTKPCIGILDLGETSYPCSVIYDRLIIFSTVSDNDIFTSINEKIMNTNIAEFHALNLSYAHNHPGPMGLIYKTSNLVFPDHFISGRLKPSRVLFFPNAKASPRWLSPMSESEVKDIKNNENYDITTIKVR